MKNIEEYVDSRHKAWCIHCGGDIGALATNRDHVPSKSLLRSPYPPNLPVVQICVSCNQGFSSDEEYLVAFLGAVLSGSTDPNEQVLETSRKALARSAKLRARIARSETRYDTLGGDSRSIWAPEAARINRVILKNARGHAFYEYGEPMFEEPSFIGVLPFASMTVEQLANFEVGVQEPSILSGWPEVGSRMLTRVLTGDDLQDGWVVVQEGVYRYAVAQNGSIAVKIVIAEYLAAEVHWD